MENNKGLINLEKKIALPLLFDKEKVLKISEIDSYRYFTVKKVYKKTKSEEK